METIKLLSANEAFYPHEGGAEKRSYELFTRLAKKGFEIKVITNPFDYQKEVDGISTEYITDLKEKQYFKESYRKVLGVMKFSSRVRDYLMRNRDFDILNFDEFPLLHAVKSSDLIKKAPASFFQWHEVLKDFYSSKGFPMSRGVEWEKQIAGIFRNHITVSKSIMTLLQRTYPVKNVHVIENGVNRRDFVNNTSKEWGKIIYVGRLEPNKRLDALIHAIRGMNDMELHIIGGGSQLERLRSLARDNTRIKLHGHVEPDELVRHIKNSWLFVLPSYREGFSIASLEAMAASVPVVTVRSEYNYAANEVIKNGFNGFVSSDFDDMVSRIKYLYSNEDEWRRLSQNAAHFTIDYDWNNIAGRLADLFRSKVSG